MADMRSLAAKRTQGAMTPETFAATLLNRLGIYQTPGAVQAIVGWQRAEGGHWHNSARFNPLNTTLPMPGYKTFQSVGVGSAPIGIYNSWQQGLDATVKTLRGDSRYRGILAALQAGDPNRVASAIGASPWGTSAAGASAAINATPRVSGVQALSGLSGAPSGASAGTQATQATTTPTFDEAGFQTARRRFALGQLLSSQGQAKDNPLFASGLVTTTAPNPQDFTGAPTARIATANTGPAPSAPRVSGPTLQLPTSFKPTHQTLGLKNYPAIDVFGKPGTPVAAPISGTVVKLSGKDPSAGAYEGQGGPFGWSVYISDGKRTYFLTHFGSRNVRVGQRVSRGQVIGTVGNYPGATPDHIHVGLNHH